MKFNRFIWDLYANSRRGKKTIKKFTHLSDNFIDPYDRIITFGDGFSIDVPKLVQESISGKKFKNLDSAIQCYEKIVKNGITVKRADNKGKKHIFFVLGDKDNKNDWYDFIAGISMGLYRDYPDFFLPYNFRCKFNQVEEIHKEFDIPLPPVPGKFDKEARGRYYLSINKVWQDFRHSHDLEAAEMCAFLYDFAPQFTSSMDVHDLPSPSKAWLVTGGISGMWDFEFIDNANEKSIGHWAGNLDARRGDILIMYCVSPRRYIHSIWRACSNGFIDPFFHYHGLVWICGKIKTVEVAFSELNKQPLLSQKPAIKAHFQGPSSKTAFSFEEYEAILEIMESKGQDLSLLPRIVWKDKLPKAEINTERDVEVQLIEPFLKRLGYKESDWVRQMSVRMGRGERNYPDYAFGVDTKLGEESAKMILESKYQLPTDRELNDSFYQAKSYALRLQSKVMVMAAKEGMWVFSLSKDGFDLKKYVYKTWSDLTHPDEFHVMLMLIGKDVILD